MCQIRPPPSLPILFPTPLPLASRPAEQMAALTDEPLEIDYPEPDESVEPELEAVAPRSPSPLAAMAPFEDVPPRPAPSAKTREQAEDAAATPIAPPAPSDRSAPQPVSQTNPAGAVDAKPANPVPSPPPKAQTQTDEVQRNPQGTAAFTAPAMVAAALTGGLRRAGPRGGPSAGASAKDAGAPPPSLLDRLAVKSILDNLRRPHAPASPSQGSPRMRAAPDATAIDGTGETPSAPKGGLRDKLGAFTADRMQARREAEQVRGATQSGTAVLASLEALERRETAGILNKIRDAGKANGGIENVLSEMRAGGAFEDLRKEFNVALAHDESFAAAYEKATSALSGYAETRAGMILAPRRRADVNLARLETLDQEIGAAAKKLPGLKDGKNALDEALEGGKEAIETVFVAVRQTLSGDASVRGPSPSPSFGP